MPLNNKETISFLTNYFHIGQTPPGQHCLPRREAGICARAIVPYGQQLAPILSTAVVSDHQEGGNEWSGATLL